MEEIQKLKIAIDQDIEDAKNNPEGYKNAPQSEKNTFNFYISMVETLVAQLQEIEQFKKQMAEFKQVVIDKTNALKEIFSKMNYTGHAWMPLDEIDDYLAEKLLKGDGDSESI